MTKITGPVTIGYNFHPEVLLLSSNTRRVNESVISAWRTEYHIQVDKVFNRIMDEVL